MVAVTFTSAAFGLSQQLTSLLAPPSDAGSTSASPQGTVVIAAASGDLTTRTALDASLIQLVRTQPGVATATGGYDQPVSFSVSRSDSLGRPPLFRGLLLSSTFDSATWKVDAGRAPKGPDEVALDAAGLVVGATKLGSTPRIELPTGNRSVRVVGIVSSIANAPTGAASADSATSGSEAASNAAIAIASAHVVLDPLVAPELLDAIGRLDQITAIPQPGIDPDDLARQLSANLPGSLQITGSTSRAATAQATIGSIDSGIQTATLIEAGLTALVAALVVANLFSVLTSQRTRELGLLRAVGGSASQIRRTVIAEAALVGAIATVVGVVLGGFLGAGAARFVQPGASHTTFVSTPTMWTTGLIVGMGVTLVGSVIPAVRAGRVSPLEALSDTGAGGEQRVSGIPALAALACGAAVIAGAVAIGGTGIARTALFGVGGAGVAWGFGRLSRAALGPLFDLLARRFRRRTITTRLAFGNLARHPARTAAAASTLMIGLALVGAVATIGATARQSIDEQLGTSGSAEIIVQRRGLVRVSTDSIVGRLSGVRGIADMAELQTVDGVVSGPGGSEARVAATPFEAMSRIVDLGLVDGAAEEGAAVEGTGQVRSGDSPTDVAMLSTATAHALGVAVGDTVTLTSTSGRTRALRVTATYANTAIVGPAVVTRQAARAIGANGSFELAALEIVDRAPFERVVNRIDDVARGFPKVGVNTPAELASLDGGIADAAIRVVAIMLIGAVGLGFGGLGGTLALSTLERRRELVLLRAVGANRTQLRTSITIESVVVGALAATVGSVAGCAVAWLALRSTGSAFGGEPVVPVAALLVVAGLATLLAAVVSLAVSRRATNVEPAEVGTFL